MIPARQRVLTRENILDVYRHLTARDFDIIDVLAEHEAFTLDQLARMFFPSRTRAGSRVGELMKHDVVERFRTAVRPGSQAWRYTLGHVGATVHAHREDDKPPRPVDTLARISKLAASRTMQHRLGVNDFVSHLIRQARSRPAVELECRGERNASEGLLGSARPDAFVRWSEDGREAAIWVEFDTGTEPHTRLLKKVAQYDKALFAADRRPALVFLLHSAPREAELQARLRSEFGELGWVATTQLEFAHDPSGDIWWPSNCNERVRLVAIKG